MEYECYELTCRCGTKVIVETTIERGFSDHEMVVCPECKNNICEIRADMGYQILEIKKPK